MAEASGSEMIVRTSRGILTRELLDAETEQRALIAEFVKKHMVEGVDFGVIPGTDKPTLLKPGAEKLIALFRCTPQFTLVKEIEDFEKNLFSYKFRVRLMQRDSGAILAEGYGSANSREGRYRWRHSNAKCPNCGMEALFKSKKKGEGYYCWKQKSGCGAQFPLTDEAATLAFKTTGKVENDDVATLANTILKMAKKRSMVDGSIALACVSDLFTQDQEDIDQPLPDERTPEQDESSNALHEEFKQAILGAKDAKTLWGIVERAKDAHKKHRLSADQNNDLVAAYKARSNEIAPGAVK